MGAIPGQQAHKSCHDVERSHKSLSAEPCCYLDSHKSIPASSRKYTQALLMLENAWPTLQQVGAGEYLHRVRTLYMSGTCKQM